MISSSVCLLAASLVVVAAMPPPPAHEMTEPMSMCHSALVTTPRGPDLPIMTTCCSVETQLTDSQCQEVLQALSGGAGAMKKMSGGVMQEKEAMPMDPSMMQKNSTMHMEPGMTTTSMPEPKPEPESSTAGKIETTTKGLGGKMEMAMNITYSAEHDGGVKATEGEKMFTMEMVAAENTIMQCLMRTTGLLSADGVVNEVAVRYVWNKRVVPSAGEEQKKKLVAAIDTCPLTSKQELMMFPQCLVKTCSAVAK